MHDVIIIGAGISGLGAARVLTRESHDVLVLEGRSRPGGRIHAVRMPYGETNSNNFGSMPNHDHLSVFHTGNSETTRNESSTKLATSESEDSLSSETTSSASCVKSPDAATKLNGSSNHVDVDLGANYLIGCSNRQNDQPLFHMAKLLNVPTAACVGDLCKKYRGWECAELAVWRNHKAPGAPIIPLTVVAEAAFLFDRVVHLTVQKHVELRKKLDKLTNNTNKDFELYGDDEPTVKEFFESALESILRSEAKFGLRPLATFRDDVEASIFDSIVARYLAYVNPLDRLPHTVLDELCEVATPRWHLSLDEPTLQSLGLLPTVPVRKLSLSDRLALLYPTVEQREAYQVWAERKLQALATGQCGSSPSVARAVNVSWEDRLVTGRFSDMLSPLMENVTIVYNAVVKAVHWDGRAGEAPITVRVCFPSDDGCEKEMLYHAKHCIITVPVGVLKGLDPRSAITFHPELPQRKREAIERLGPPYRGAPTHEKVILRFRVPDDIFWDVNAAHLKCPDARLHILNLHHYGKPGILCAHIWGGSGLCPAGQSDKAVVDVLLNLLDQMYPEAQYPRDGKLGVPEPVSYIVTRWCEDPFALGAYTTGEPGSSDTDRLAYAASLTDEDGDCLSTDTKSMPRLLFAGEGTLTASEAKECTHGALLTGVARALDLLPYLNNNKSTESDSTDNQCDDQVLARSLESTRSLILGKLAHYLIGRPHLSWSANLNCQRSDRKNRRISTRPTPYSPMSKSSNGERKDFSLKSELRRTMVRRHTKLEGGSPVRSNLFGGNDGRRRVAGRGHSTAARNSALSRNSKRTDQVWKRVGRRKQQSRRDSLEPSAETQSETSSTTIEARISGSSSGSPEPRNQTILTRVMSGLQELSASWHLFPSLDRQRFLTDLVGLVDELHSRHLLLDTPQPSTVRTSSPMGDADSLHLVPPENPMAQFPFPF